MCSIPLVVIYPLMKRWTYWPQLVLGLTFNWGIWVGWVAAGGALSLSLASGGALTLLAPLYMGAVAWTVLYDTIYAHQDTADDVLIGVKSTALRFGSHSKQALAALATTTLAMLALAGTSAAAQLGHIYYTIAVGAGAMHLTWQLVTVRLHQRASCMRTFVSNIYFGWIVLAAIVLDRLFAAPAPTPAPAPASSAASAATTKLPLAAAPVVNAAAPVLAPATAL